MRLGRGDLWLADIGGFAWYVRVGSEPLIRVRGEFGTPEFIARYEAALRGERLQHQHSSTKVGSLTWLIERYKETQAWRNLSSATRRQRENIFK